MIAGHSQTLNRYNFSMTASTPPQTTSSPSPPTTSNQPHTADVTPLLPGVNRLRERFRARRVSIVAYRGRISATPIAALESEKLDCDYILGARMRSVKEISERVLADRGRYQAITPERKRSKDPSPLKVKEVTIEGRRYIVCLNEEQRRKDAADRQAIVEHLRE